MSDEEAKAPGTVIEEIPGGRKAGFGAKVRGHFRRFWWLHLIFFVCSTLIIVLCL